MRQLSSLLWFGALLVACDDLPGRSTVQECSGSSSCRTSDCYAECFCTSGARAACERECGAPTVRVADLDETSWMAAWVEREDEVLALTNAERARGGCCGDEGCFGPARDLEFDPDLRRAARSHAFDMAERDYFAHDSPDGISPFDRMREAHFTGCAMGENIAAGQPTAADVVRAWRDSPGHCANMLSPLFDHIGVGYHPDTRQNGAHLWVQNFGAK